jgi:light-regulated signal transduction histidine kinase (bacteriophytochrome)
MAEFAVNAAARMSALLNDLLLLATTGHAEPLRSVNLQDVLQQATGNLGLAINESHATITAGPLPLVEGNHGYLVRIFQNLIANSLKYRGADLPEIHISARRNDREWVISVIDNGIGVAAEHHEHIFGLFTRLHGQELPGTGIGLAFWDPVPPSVSPLRRRSRG